MKASLSILNLEDSADDAELNKEMISARWPGCKLVRVDRRSDFISALDQGGFDLILSDYTMPGFDGREALQLAREKRPEIPFLFVSGTIGEDAAIEALKNGASDYVLKHRLMRLIPAVDRALHESEEHAEYQRADEAMRQSEHKYRELFECLGDGAFLAEEQSGKIIDANRRAETVLGCTRADILGRKETRFLRLDQVRPSAESSGTDTPTTTTIECELIRADAGTIRVEVRTTRLTLYGRALVLRLFHQIKRAAEEIRKLNTTLEQCVVDRTAQLEAVNSELEAFTYSVSHDLRAPLRHISAFAELLTQSSLSSLDDSGKHYLGVISEAAKQMATLIDDLLVFSRTGRAELRRTKVNMDELVGEVVREMDHDLAGRDIAWEVGPLPELIGDRAMLKQVWLNLLSNAVKYTRHRERATIKIASRKNEHRDWEFSVQDNGAGFDMKYAGKLYGVFQRLHQAEEFEGTGIGLANVRRIILRHGGRVWAEGRVDAGATFYFSLPNLAKEEI